MSVNKYVRFFLCVCLCVCVLSGCGSNDISDGRIKIVCTTFPQYDWVMNIIAGDEDSFDVSLIVDNGSDLHSYQPTTEDIVSIETCDVLIYVGGESDFWVEDALEQSSGRDMSVVRLMDTLEADLYEEEHIEGMTGEDDHDGPGGEYDEHIWLSLRNAEKLVYAIADVICTKAPAGARLYNDNAKLYASSLENLDSSYSELISSSARHILLFGDRFPFRYMVEDYGLEYYAAFGGCSAETEAGFETITYLSGKLDETGIPVVLILENADDSVAKAIVGNSKDRNQKIMTINSAQSVTMEDINNGVTYLSIMQDNLDVLREALN